MNPRLPTTRLQLPLCLVVVLSLLITPIAGVVAVAPDGQLSPDPPAAVSSVELHPEEETSAPVAVDPESGADPSSESSVAYQTEADTEAMHGTTEVRTGAASGHPAEMTTFMQGRASVLSQQGKHEPRTGGHGQEPSSVPLADPNTIEMGADAHSLIVTHAYDDSVSEPWIYQEMMAYVLRPFYINLCLLAPLDVGEQTINIGAVDEDVFNAATGYCDLLLTTHHAWDPDDNTTWESIGGHTSLEWANYYLDMAVDYYFREDHRRAYYYLGRVAHLLGDAATPAHVHGDEHLPGDSDSYEEFLKILTNLPDQPSVLPFDYVEFRDITRLALESNPGPDANLYLHLLQNAGAFNSGSAETLWAEGPVIVHKDPEWGWVTRSPDRVNKDLFHIFYWVAERSDDYDSNDAEGEGDLVDNSDGLEDVYELTTIREGVWGRGVQGIAALLELFFELTSGRIQDIRVDDLVQGQWGKVSVDVVAPADGEYKVGVWDDDGWTAPEWEWQWTESGVVYLDAEEPFTFDFYAMADDSSEGFEFWLYREDALGLFRSIDQVEHTLYAMPPDTIPPVVVSYRYGTSPATNIFVAFSEDMDGATFSDATISVTGSSSGSHSSAYSFDHSTFELTINPNADFAYGETVAVTISTGVQDLAGNGMASPYTIQFAIESEPGPDPTSLDLSGTLDPSANVPAYSTVHVYGTVYYNTGEPVPVGALEINTGENIFTAAISDGSFDRYITAPSSSRNIAITARDGTYGLSATIYRYISILPDQGGGGYTLDATYVVSEVDDDVPVWWAKEAFRTTEDDVNSLVYFTDVFQELGVKWEFYYPDGSQYGSDLVWDGAVSDPHDYGYDWWDWYYVYWGFLIDGKSMAAHPGRYTIKVYVDNGSGYDYKKTDDYVVAWDFTEHRMCKDVDGADPFLPIDETNVFKQTDEKAVAWHNFDLVAQSGNVKCEFYEPSGALYGTETYAMDDPGDPDSWWDWYRHWAWIWIDGYAAEQKCGRWTVKFYVQNPTTGTWEQQYTDYFEIQEDPAQAPMASVTASPAEPIETQSIALDVAASDNTYLQQVTLYWNDGSLHSQTWDNIYASFFNQSRDIGSYNGGQQIEFWSVSLDTSGNPYESEHHTLTVAAETLTIPDQPAGESYRLVDQPGIYATGGSTTSLSDPVEYQFDWGNGLQSTWGGASQTYWWPAEGTYLVKARARCQSHPDRISNWSPAFVVVVDSTAPVVEFTTNGGEDFETEGDQLVLQGIAYDPVPASGLASVVISAGEPNGGTLSNWSFTVDLAEGPNVLVVTAEDNAINMGQDTIVVTKTVAVAIEGLTAANDSPTPLGDWTILTATVTAGGNIGYSWDFGDGEFDSGEVVSHTYPAVGVYTAIVTASNPVNSLTATTVVTITERTFCDDVSELPKIECEALVALYESTDGSHWTDNTGWLATDTPCTDWYGVTCDAGHVSQLSLGANQLAGTIPLELGSLSDLRSLYLFSNQLTGDIPTQLDGLADLQILSLWDNQLAGPIPLELGSLPSLRYLYLGSNQLTGSIPPELATLADLEELSLWGNQLTGTVPPELGGLAHLLHLGLASNQLTGNIPPALGDLASLHTLSLGGNQLTGPIPPELATLTNLQILTLDNNQLTGNIPLVLGDLALLQYLELDGNQLTGNIPPGLGSLTDLVVLYVQNNALSGEVPPELASLANLSYLDVGYNALVASDPTAAAFLDANDPDWWETQTVPPTDLAVIAVTSDTVVLSWTPIPYTADGGYYEVIVAPGDWEPYTLNGASADKLASSYLVDGLSPGDDYYFAVRTHTPAHGFQQNDLWSGYTAVVSATTEPGPAFSASGRILAEEGGAIPGVEVWAYSAIGVSESISATTDADGLYAMEDLAGSTHWLYPRYLGWAFAPLSREVDGLADATGQDFVGFTDEGWNVVLVSALGGGYRSVAVQDAYAYAGQGFGMTVLDLSQPATPTVVGRTSVLDGFVGGIAPAGEYTLVAAGIGGLQVVDIADPTNPTPVAAHDTLGSAASVTLSGDYAYVASARRPQDGEYMGAGLEVVNVADPEQPVWVAHYATPQDVVDVAVISGYAYLAEEVEYEGNLPVGGGLRVLDVSDPSAPADLGLQDTAGHPRSVVVSGGYAYLAEGCAWDGEQCTGGGLRVFDLSDPAHPQEVVSYLPPSLDEINDVAVMGDRAYLTAGYNLYVLDVSDPADPQPLGLCPTSAWGAGIAIVDGLLYLAGGELSVVDVTLPSAPVEVGVADQPILYASDVVVDGDYAYVAGMRGLQIVDVSQPHRPVALGRCELPEAVSLIALHGDYAFLVDGADNLLVVNVSDPLAPQLAGSYSTGPWVTDMALWGDYLYLAVDCSWEDGQCLGGLQVFDISDRQNLELVRYYDLPGGTEAVVIDGGYAYVSQHCVWSGDVCVGGALRILDVSDPTDPFEVGSLPADPWALAVEGDRAYVHDQTRRRLLIVDISDRTAPVELGSWPSYFSWFGMAVADGYAYASTDKYVEVVDVTGESDPVMAGAFAIRGLTGLEGGLAWPMNVALENGYAYLGWGEWGLAILRFKEESSTYSISGRVTDGVDPLPGVTVSADGVSSATTGATGYYTITGLLADTYVLTPTLEGWSFTPPTATVTVPPDAVGVDFVGQPLCPPFDRVELQGPEAGYTTFTYAYTAALIPMGYEPITYTWSPEPLWGQESAVAGYGWDEPATYSITVEAEACGPPLSTTLEVRILTHQVTETVEPGLGTTLTFTDTQGNETTIQVPAGAVSEMITLVYTVVETPTVPFSFVFAGHAFILEAYQGGELLPDYRFSQPVTITIEYSDADVEGLDEETLELRYWTGAEWSTDGITVVERDVDGNRLVVLVDHLSQFALLATRQPTVYLPLILRFYPPNLPPYSPTEPSPPDGATDQPLDLTLAWTGGDPDGDTVTYDVYMDADESTPQTLVCEDASDPACTPDALVTGTVYYWQVVATDERGATTTGPIWSFATTTVTCQEEIGNGGFESDGDWEIPITPYRAAYSTAEAHSGSRSMRTGIVDPTDNVESWSSARQAVTIPAGAVSATLRFWLYPLSDEPTTPDAPSLPLPLSLEAATLDGDVHYVLILNESNGVIDRILWQRRDDQAWTYHEADLLDYAGQTVKVQFGTYNDGLGGVTAMYVDDVSLEVCSP